MLTTLFLSLFGFFLPPKFPSGAFVVVQEATQNELSSMMGVLQILLQNEATMLTTFFLCLFFPSPTFQLLS
jgi:hypothetical protein